MTKTIAALLIASALLTGCGEAERGPYVWVERYNRWIYVGEGPIVDGKLHSISLDGVNWITF